jgi:hypothetical protein
MTMQNVNICVTLAWLNVILLSIVSAVQQSLFALTFSTTICIDFMFHSAPSPRMLISRYNVGDFTARSNIICINHKAS